MATRWRRWCSFLGNRTPLLLLVAAMAIAPWIGMHDGVRPLDVLTRGAMAVHAQSHAAGKVLGQEGHGPTSSTGHAPDEVHAPGTCACCPIDDPHVMVLELSRGDPAYAPPPAPLQLFDRIVSPESPPPQI